jgi:hypothetical protein
MTKSISIFGAGISGLTIAHILCVNGFKVTLYESENIIGGMARSKRENVSGVPTEHSWRGYAPFYHNLNNIIKQIPLINDPDKSVFDNLSPQITFSSLENIKDESTSPTILDFIKIGYIMGKYIFSDERDKRENYLTRVSPVFKKHLSSKGYKFFIHFIMGPGWGMDKDEASIGHYTRFSEFSVIQTNFLNIPRWKVMTLPTQEAWFNHWEIFLKNLGVTIEKNTYLKQIIHSNEKIEECIVKNDQTVKNVKSDEYIFSINPFNLSEIFKNSRLHNLYELQTKSNEKSDYPMIAFAIPIYSKIKWEKNSKAYILSDGPLNITFYAQEQFWKNKANLGENVQSLLSGTCIVTNKIVNLYDKKGINLTLEELKNEIIHEFIISEDLQNIMMEYNFKNLTKNDLKNIIIWDEWKYDNGQLKPKYKKYSNNIYNQFNRMKQKTSLINGYISGSHTDTSIEIWSMEGAVESGIITSNHILEKYGKELHHLHTHSRVKTIVHSIDNGLYNMGLPHIIDSYLIVILIILIVGVVFLTKKNKYSKI